MRLLYLCSDFGIAPGGTKGASIHLRAITGALAALGHEVRLISPREGPDASHPVVRALPAGCPELETAFSGLRGWLTRRELNAEVCAELRALAYNAWASESAVTALRADPPAAVIERLSLFGHLGLDLAAEFDVPLIVEVNALLTEEAGRFRSLHMHGLAEEIERRVLTRADAVIAVSRPLAERIAQQGVDPRRIEVVPNGVDLNSFRAAPSRTACRAALGLNGEFVVGFSGSLKAWHGVDVLMDAFNQLQRDDPSAKLLIVGDGPMLPALRARARAMGGGDRVIFTGAVAHERMPALLRALDVAAAPFRGMTDFYFSPIKLFEYMAAGACVVASRLGQIEEVIDDGVNGLLCDADSPHSLHAALDRARTDPALRAELASAALRTVSERYTWRHAARSTAGLVEQCIADRARGSRPNAAELLETVHS